MKELNAEQLDRIARRLDGSSEPLAGDEQALADELAALEQALAGRLDAEAPADALSRVRRRMRAETAGPGRTLRVRFTGPLALAAVVLLAAGAAIWVRAIRQTTTVNTENSGARIDPGAGSPLGAEQLAGVAEALRRPARDADLDVLTREIDELGADTVASATSADAELDALERDFEELLIDYPASGPAGT